MIDSVVFGRGQFEGSAVHGHSDNQLPLGYSGLLVPKVGGVFLDEEEEREVRLRSV